MYSYIRMYNTYVPYIEVTSISLNYNKEPRSDLKYGVEYTSSQLVNDEVFSG